MRPDSREGALGRQEGVGEAQQHRFSLSSPDSKETQPPVLCSGSGEGRWPRAPSACSGAAPLQGPPEPSESSAWLGRCWLQKAPPGGFFPQGKEKRDFDGARDAPRPGRWICDVNSSPRSLSCREAGMEGLQGAGRQELGVFPEDLCHKGGHVSLFGVVQGEERVFHKF